MDAQHSASFISVTPINLVAPDTQKLTQMGVLSSKYSVTEYHDARMKPDGTSLRRAYAVTLVQKLTLSNPDANSFAALPQYPQYRNYPVLAVQRCSMDTPPAGVSCYLDDYYPKTLNASVQTSSSDTASSASSSSFQRTSGSNLSETSSYQVSGSADFSIIPSGSMSWTSGQDRSVGFAEGTAQTATSEQTAGSGVSSAMSIKDWASYAFVSADQRDIGWVWAQEYPWDVIAYHSVSQSYVVNSGPIPSTAPITGGTITIPTALQQRFWDGEIPLPPSAIAQFGVSFVGWSRWLVLVDAARDEDEIIQMTHALTYWQGLHSMGTPGINIVTADTDIETVSLNLPVLAIQPIVAANIPAAAATAISPATPAVSNGAVLAFVQSEFIVSPTAGATPFRAKSGANNLYVRGTGFAAPARGDGVLTANAITAAAPATLTLQFKITKPTLPLSLFLRHWKTSGAPCTVTIAINEADPVHPVAPIVLQLGYGLDDAQASGLDSVVLRDTDIASRHLRDYLLIGLNQIVITVTPAEGEAECGYALRGIAIG